MGQVFRHKTKHDIRCAIFNELKSNPNGQGDMVSVGDLAPGAPFMVWMAKMKRLPKLIFLFRSLILPLLAGSLNDIQHLFSNFIWEGKGQELAC